MQNWNQQDDDLMQVQSELYTALLNSPNLI
jgi:hypothetical protein